MTDGTTKWLQWEFAVWHLEPRSPCGPDDARGRRRIAGLIRNLISGTWNHT